MQTEGQRLERFSRAIVPAVVTVLFLFLSAMPQHIPGLHAIWPNLVLISIYFWRVFQPETMPYLFLFALGFVQDALTGMPVGTSSFVYVAFGYLVGYERRIFGHTIFWLTWLGFGALLFIALVIQWALLSFYLSTLVTFFPGLFHWCTTFIVYPLMHKMFLKLHNRLTDL